MRRSGRLACLLLVVVAAACVTTEAADASHNKHRLHRGHHGKRHHNRQGSDSCPALQTLKLKPTLTEGVGGYADEKVSKSCDPKTITPPRPVLEDSKFDYMLGHGTNAYALTGVSDEFGDHERVWCAHKCLTV